MKSKTVKQEVTEDQGLRFAASHNNKGIYLLHLLSTKLPILHIAKRCQGVVYDSVEERGNQLPERKERNLGFQPSTADTLKG